MFASHLVSYLIAAVFAGGYEGMLQNWGRFSGEKNNQ